MIYIFAVLTLMCLPASVISDDTSEIFCEVSMYELCFQWLVESTKVVFKLEDECLLKVGFLT